MGEKIRKLGKLEFNIHVLPTTNKLSSWFLDWNDRKIEDYVMFVYMFPSPCFSITFQVILNELSTYPHLGGNAPRRTI